MTFFSQAVRMTRRLLLKRQKSFDESAKNLSKGDEARDNKEWIQAILFYESYLSNEPQHWEIWVQLAHARKESGDFTGAEIAYKRALQLAPNDADVYLQLGHLYKITDRPQQAIYAYRRAHSLDPSRLAPIELTELENEERSLRSVKANLADIEHVEMPDVQWRAREAFESENWENLYNIAEQCVQMDPEDPFAWLMRGDAEAFRTGAGGACVYYERALSLVSYGKKVDASHKTQSIFSNTFTQTVLRNAFSLKPTLQRFQVLRSIGMINPLFGIEQSHQSILLDLTDVLQFLQAHGTLTGIQRVQIGIVNAVRDDPSLSSRNRVLFVFASETDSFLWQIQPLQMDDLINYCLSEKVDQLRVKSVIKSIRANSTLVHVGNHSLYVILGAFWSSPNSSARYYRLKVVGVKVGVLIHDLFPITDPDYVGPGVSEHFERDLLNGFMFWDFIFCNSQYTARELSAYMKSRALKPIPIMALPLAHVQGTLRSNNQSSSQADATNDLPKQLRGRRFVLCVSTIEIRKNHLALFNAWRMLVKDGTRVLLVLVGRHGWRVESLMEQMQASGLLGSDIILLDHLSDPELIAAYQHCLFTVLPSFAEGWGLSIGEALSHGKMCVASNTTSMPEVGGEFVLYFDPFNTRSLYDAVRMLIDDPEFLRAREQSITDHFVVRTWNHVARDMFVSLNALSTEKQIAYAASPLQPARLGLNQCLWLSDNVGKSDLTGTIERDLVLIDGWCRPESFGSWLGGPIGQIQFRSDALPNTTVRVAAMIRSVPWAVENTLDLITNVGHTSWIINPDSEMLISVDAAVSTNGIILIDFILKGPLSVPEGIVENRSIRIGVTALAVLPGGFPAASVIAPLTLRLTHSNRASWIKTADASRALIQGWMPIKVTEPHTTGALMRGSKARIGLSVKDAGTSLVRLLLRFRVFGDASNHCVVLTNSSGARFSRNISERGEFDAWIDCSVPRDGAVILDLRCKPCTKSSNGFSENPTLCLEEICIADLRSPAERLMLLEYVALPSMSHNGAIYENTPESLHNHWPDPVGQVFTWLGVRN